MKTKGISSSSCRLNTLIDHHHHHIIKQLNLAKRTRKMKTKTFSRMEMKKNQSNTKERGVRLANRTKMDGSAEKKSHNRILLFILFVFLTSAARSATGFECVPE